MSQRAEAEFCNGSGNSSGPTHSKAVGGIQPTASPLFPQRAVFLDSNRRGIEPTVEHESLPLTPGSTQRGYVSLGYAQVPFRGGGTGNKLHLMSVQLRCATVPSSGSKSNIERWERAFAALCKFRAREGHCCPRRDHIEGGFKLGQWVCVQRYLKGDVLPERKRRLDAFGFVWDWRDNLWEQNFAALLKFRRRNGHCCVPTHYLEGDLKVGWWVASQRRNKKQMSAERRKRLNKIGFVWSMGFMGPITYQLFIREISAPNRA